MQMNYSRSIWSLSLFSLFLTCSLAFADYQIKSDDVRVDASAFSNNLSSTDTNAQKVFDKIDDVAIVHSESDPVHTAWLATNPLSGYATQSWVGQQAFVTGAPWTSAGYITGIDSSDVTTALGYTPLQSSDISDMATETWVGQQGFITGTPWTSEGYYVGDGSAFATSAQGALADTAVQGTPWEDEGYYVGDGSAFATAAQGGLADSALQSFTELDPIVASQTNGFTITRGTTPATLTVSATGSVSGSNTGDQTLSSLGAQAALNGTGFVKASGTTITYDNSTYLTSLSGALLATGATTGATSEAQAFTNGVKTGKVYPSADATTAFQINKADGTTNVLNVDTTNARVGIGTNAPLTQFHVDGASAGISVHRTGANEPFIRLSQSPDYSICGGQIRGIGTAAGLRFTDVGAVAEWARFNATGQLGIGDAAPDSALVVKGANPEIRLRNSSNTQSVFRFYKDSTTEIGNIRSYGADNSVALEAGSPAGEIARFIKTGVGIGSTAPLSLLDVQGAGVAVTGPTNVQALIVDTASMAANVGGALGFRGKQTAAGAYAYFAAIKGAKENATEANYASYMNFFTRANGGNLTEQLRITSAGKVGVGTTAPTYKFETAGSAIADGARSWMGFDTYFVPRPVFTSANLALVADDTGLLGVGAYKYSVTYTTALGETEGSVCSAPAVITTDATHTKVTITLPVSTDTRVTGRKIYRTAVGGAEYLSKLLATIANNTATTYEDNIADASLTGDTDYYRSNTTAYLLSQNGARVLSMPVGNSNSNLFMMGGNNTLSGGRNVGIGSGVLTALTSGTNNFGIGNATLQQCTTGASNVGIGYLALNAVATTNYNTAIGHDALYRATGSNNTALGGLTGFTATAVNNCLFLGYAAGQFETGSNTIIVDTIGRTNEATQRTSAPIYAVASSTLANQIVSLAGSAGKVGIGTIAPSATISLVNATGTLINATSNSVLRHTLDGATGAPTWYLNNTSAEAGKISYSTPGGNVGITLYTDATYDQNRFDIVNNKTNFTMGYNIDQGYSGHVFTITQGGGDALGRIGIGTSAPDRKVEVNDASGNCLRLTYNDLNGTATNNVDFLVSSSGDLTITPSGGDVSLGTSSLALTGSIGATGSRVTKLWATDITVTNAIAGSVTGNAATVTTNANLTGPITSVGNATTITAGSVKANMLQASAADLGAADVTVNFGNTNGAYNTNITTDGTLAASNLSGANTGDNSANSTYASDYRPSGADVAVADGGTGLSTIADGSILATNTADTLSAITWHSAGDKVLTNKSGTISWETATAGGGGFTTIGDVTSGTAAFDGTAGNSLTAEKDGLSIHVAAADVDVNGGGILLSAAHAGALDADTFGHGGGITLSSGDGIGTGYGGAATMTAGAGGSGATGASVTALGGDKLVAGNGGDLILTGGLPDNDGIRGTVQIHNVKIYSSSSEKCAIFETLPTWTTDKTYTFPNKSGTFAMTSDITGTNSGTNTGDNAANSSSTYIGTTAVALNRGSGALTLAGITLTTPNIGVATATANIKGEPKHIRFAIMDPAGAYAISPTLCLVPSIDAAITVTSVKVTLDATTNEVLGDLKRADAFIGLANAAVVNDFDTTSGVRDDSTITSAAIASRKAIYLSFDSAPNAAIKIMNVDITYTYD